MAHTVETCAAGWGRAVAFDGRCDIRVCHGLMVVRRAGSGRLVLVRVSRPVC